MDYNVYQTKEKKKKGLVAMIFGIVGGALLIVCPFMNFGTLHFHVSANSVFDAYISELVNEEEDETDEEVFSCAIDYGLDMFELRKMGANYVEFGMMDRSEAQDWRDASREAEDFVRYDLDLESIGIEIDDKVYDELFGIIDFSVFGYNALCIVPFVLIGMGILIIVFSATRHPVPGLICSFLAGGGAAWLISCSDRFLAIVGLGGFVMLAALAICVISAICGIVTKR